MKQVRFRDQDANESVINPTLRRLSASQPNNCDEEWDGLKRWKASVGSASSRSYESKRKLPSDSLDEHKQIIHSRSQHMLIDLGDGDEKEDRSAVSETDTTNSFEDDSESAVTNTNEMKEFIDTSENSCSIFQKEDKLNSEVNDDSSWMIELERSNMNNSCCNEQEINLHFKITLLERYLDEQEIKINDLEVKVGKIRKENNELVEKVSKKRQNYFALDDKYTALKIEVAEARADEDDLNYELTEMVNIRDNQSEKLKNEIKEMRARIERMEIENKYYMKKLERAESITQQKNSRLLNTLSRVDLLKSERSLLKSERSLL